MVKNKPRFKVTVVILLFILMASTLVVSWLYYAIMHSFLGVHKMIDRTQDAMVLPQNYKPAGRMLALMAQSDRRIFKGGFSNNDWPPVCIPVELGKFSPSSFTIKPDECRMDCGAGFIEDFCYDLILDKAASNANTNTWILTFSGNSPRHPEKGLYRFVMAKDKHLTEMAVVKNALAELDRHKPLWPMERNSTSMVLIPIGSGKFFCSTTPRSPEKSVS